MCRQITAAFFAPNERLRDDLGYQLSWGPQARHWPVNLLKESATRGCPLCVILAGTVNANWLSEDLRQTRFTSLHRGVIDPHANCAPETLQIAEISPKCSFALHVDLDDISHGVFFKIPKPWCR